MEDQSQQKVFPPPVEEYNRWGQRDGFGQNGVRVEFDRNNCEKMKAQLAYARQVFRDRHLGNNKTMKDEKRLIDGYIQILSCIVEEEKKEQGG